MAVRVRQKSRDEEWNRNMGAARQQNSNNMLAMALKMNDQQAIGYLIGALGKKLWMDHLARRHAREDADQLGRTGTTPANGTGMENTATFGTVPVTDNAGNPVSPKQEVASPVKQEEINATGLYVNPSNNYDVSPLPMSPEARYYDYLNRGVDPSALSRDELMQTLAQKRWF